ncbi:partitioning defective 6 gamma-like, partial [Clarias magur]
MYRSFNNKTQSLRHTELDAVEVKSKYGAEFRRFSVNRVKPGKFEEFFKLIMNLHRIANMEVMIGYADVHGDLLPINNDDNFCKAVTTAHPLLRIFIQRQGPAFGACTALSGVCVKEKRGYWTVVGVGLAW